jgi:hypothetical protein
MKPRNASSLTTRWIRPYGLAVASVATALALARSSLQTSHGTPSSSKRATRSRKHSPIPRHTICERLFVMSWRMPRSFRSMLPRYWTIRAADI